MATFITSDLHFGHKNIIRYCNRPVQTVEEMDLLIITTWNSQVGPEDSTFILGDLSFVKAHSNPETLAKFVSNLNGTKIFVLGNHDSAIKQSLIHCINYAPAKVTKVCDYLESRYEGECLVMCHYPMVEWNRSHRGSIMLHGHCHGTRRNLPGNIFDVGIDGHPDFRLWTMEEAIENAKENGRKNPGSNHQTGL